MNEQMDVLLSQLKSSNPMERRYAIQDIGDQRLVNAVPQLIGMLSDNDLSVREAAVDSLRTFPSRLVCSNMLGFLSSEDVWLRNAAVEILEKSSPANALLIGEHLRKTHDSDVKKFCLEVLDRIEIRDDNLRQQIGNYILPLLHDINQNVVLSAIEAIGTLKLKSSIADLEALWNIDPWRQATIVEALRSIGGFSSYQAAKRLNELSPHRSVIKNLNNLIQTLGKRKLQ